MLVNCTYSIWQTCWCMPRMRTACRRGHTTRPQSASVKRPPALLGGPKWAVIAPRATPSADDAGTKKALKLRKLSSSSDTCHLQRDASCSGRVQRNLLAGCNWLSNGRAVHGAGVSMLTMRLRHECVSPQQSHRRHQSTSIHWQLQACRPAAAAAALLVTCRTLATASDRPPCCNG